MSWTCDLCGEGMTRAYTFWVSHEPGLTDDVSRIRVCADCEPLLTG